MTDIRETFADDAALVVGAAATVYWTNCGRAYHGRGVVTKVNAKSVLVALTDGVGGPDMYPAGREIKAPRIGAYKLWSVQNRAVPDR